MHLPGKSQFQHSARILTQALAREASMIPMCKAAVTVNQMPGNGGVARRELRSKMAVRTLALKSRFSSRHSATTQLRLHGLLHKCQCQSEQFRISAPMTVRLKRILQNSFFCKRVCFSSGSFLPPGATTR